MKDKMKECSQCGKRTPMADTFILDKKAYCMDCLYPLIMAIYESGHMIIDMEDCEEEGLRIDF